MQVFLFLYFKFPFIDFWTDANVWNVPDGWEGDAVLITAYSMMAPEPYLRGGLK